MPDIPIEQAIYGGQGAGGYRFLARSPGFREEWLSEAQRLCTSFGERPAGVACPAAVFAHPLDKTHVAVVQVADQGTDDAGRPGALGFRLLVLPREAYSFLGGDPFALADRFPPPWEARGGLPALTCPDEPARRRSLEQVQAVLESYRDVQPTLLGAAQALVDGGRVVFERSAPDADLLRALWVLLPTASREGLWPASFAFGNALGFDAAVAPRARDADYAGYVFESQAGDYPEGQYELSLQVAAESGSQADLDALFARRGRHDVRRVALVLVAAVAFLTLAVGVLTPSAPPGAPAPTKRSDPTRPDLPPADQFRALDAPERRALTEALAALAAKVGVPEPKVADAEVLVDALDSRLGTPDARRNPGPLRDQGPVTRRLRLLLWKHGVAGYNDPKLNANELVERLQQHLSARKKDVGDGGTP